MKKKTVLVIMGMKHCGKTTVGKLLADGLSLPFFDLDHVILEMYDPQKNLTIRDIYKAAGDSGFRNMETHAIMEIINTIENKPPSGNFSAVCSLGGGSIENGKVLEILTGSSIFCYIHEDVEVLYKRIIARGVPAFLDPSDPWSDFQRIYSLRTRLYEDKADICIIGKGRDSRLIYKSLILALQEARNAG